MTDKNPAPADNQPSSDESGAVAPAVPPMTATLMGRLFVVPALVVVVMLAVAVVVILFGASPIDKPRTVAELFNVIESDSGERSLGNLVLSPKSKQTWQAAQELAIRFEKGQFDGEPVEPMAERMIAIIRDRSEKSSDANAEDAGRDSGIALQQFLILALAKLKTVRGLEATTDLLQDPDPQIRRIALQGIAEMRDMPESRGVLIKLYPLLEDPAEEVRIVAALAVASVAPRGDQAAIDRIDAMPATGRDLQMNQATALAKLGSTRGKLMMLNMLDREYWRKLSAAGDDATTARPLSDQEISARLIALAPIAAQLGDADVTEAVRRLGTGDESPQVRDAASAALAQATGSSAAELNGDIGAQAGVRISPIAEGA